MIIEVYRADGLRSGTPIVEPLLSAAALIQRGCAEMDAHAHAINTLDLAVVFRPGLRLGQLVALSDPVTASPQRAKITGIQINITAAAIETHLTLEQPR